MASRGIGIIGIVYLIAGAVIANDHHFFSHLDGLKPILSAILGVILWPLILLGVNLHLK
jgi:hypothetical protein